MKKMLLPVVCAAITAATLLSGGCSFFNHTPELVAVNVKQQDATVLLNGTKYTGVPFFAEVSRGQNLLISIYTPRRPARLFSVERELSRTGVLDACGGILIFPLFGLLSDGAWTLETNNIYVDLDDFKSNIKEVKNTEKL